MLLEDVYYTNIKKLYGRLTSYGHLLFFCTFSHRLTYFFKPCFNLIILKISKTQHNKTKKTTQQPKCDFLSTPEILHLVFLEFTTTFSQTKSTLLRHAVPVVAVVVPPLRLRLPHECGQPPGGCSTMGHPNLHL